MVKTTKTLLQELSEYKVPATKISRMVRDGELLVVKRGLYETDRACPPEGLSGAIYGPSYLSFEYALSYYGLIPERVTVYTSATFRKNRSKRFENDFGQYTYQDVAAEAFPYGVTIKSQGEYTWRIARPEKALCDLLSTRQSLLSVKDMECFLFEGMRIEREDFEQLDYDRLLTYAERYRNKNLKLLHRYVEGLR